MKLLNKILIAILLVSTCLMSENSVLKAQNSEEPNEVKLLVQQQILEAKRKNIEAKLESISDKKIASTAPKIAVDRSNTSYGIPGHYLIKGAIFLTGAVSIFFWLAVRRVKKQRIEKNNLFKSNIKKMREEKFIKEIDPKLKEIRTRLTLTSVVLNEDKKVIAAAKKSQIGKEEILLASRIRSHEIQYGGQRSFA